MLKQKLAQQTCDPLAAEKLKKKIQSDPRTAEIWRLKEQLEAAKRAERRAWAKTSEESKRLKKIVRRLKTRIRRMTKQLLVQADNSIEPTPKYEPLPVPFISGVADYVPTFRDKAREALPYAACGVTAGVIGFYALRSHPAMRTLAYSLAIGLSLYALDLII